MIGYTDGDSTWTSTTREIPEVRVLRFSPEDRPYVKKEEIDMLVEHGIVPVFVKNVPTFAIEPEQGGAA